MFLYHSYAPCQVPEVHTLTTVYHGVTLCPRYSLFVAYCLIFELKCVFLSFVYENHTF